MHRNQENLAGKAQLSSEAPMSSATSTNVNAEEMDQSKQAPRELCVDDVTCSLKEITLIETVTSFLEQNGASEVDPKVVHNLAEALSKRIDTTSPLGAIPDSNMDNYYNSFNATRSPGGGNHSPMALQGRSVRDLEEQMSTLRKENFNLKLRIYFMEEGQLNGRGQNSSDTVTKQLIDAKIEIEHMRKQIEDKTELLKDAARAIMQHEEIQKKAENENQILIENLQLQIRQLESDHDAKTIETLCNDKLKRAEGKVRNLEIALLDAHKQHQNFQMQFDGMQRELLDRQNSLMVCEAKIEELAIKNAELVEKVDRQAESCEVTNQKLNKQSEELNARLAENRRWQENFESIEHNLLNRNVLLKQANATMDLQTETIEMLNFQSKSEFFNAELADKQCEIQELEEKLKERERIHEQACRTIQKLMHKVNSQEKEIKCYKQQQQQSDCTTGNASNTSPTAIECVSTSNVSESTCHGDDLASLRQHYEQRAAEQEETIQQLQAEVKKKTANLQNLVNKELWEKNREVERLTQLLAGKQPLTAAALPADATTNSGSTLQQSYTETDYAKALERNKLLQRKVDVLIQRLSEERKNDDMVAELQRELSVAHANVENANKWRLECADVCGVLTIRLEELAGFLNSLLKHKDVLGVLAADRRQAMRSAVDRSLDLSKSLNLTLSMTGTALADQSLTQLCNLSQILYDADEGNRTFNSHEDFQAAAVNGAPTIETLKAENKALRSELEKRRSTDGRKERRSLPLAAHQCDNQSESEAWSEPDRKVSMARMGLEETSSSLVCEQRHTESESEGRQGRLARQERGRNSERVAQLEELIAQRDERILSVQCQLVDADSRFKQEQLRVMDITKQLEQLQLQNATLHIDLLAIGKREQNDAAELQLKLDTKSKELLQLQSAHMALTADVKITEMELKEAQEQVLSWQQQHELVVNKLTQLTAEVADKLEELQQQHKLELANNWVELVTYEEQKQQLLELQRQHIEQMRTIEIQQENEQELKQALIENELTARELKKQLDESALQACKAVKERTKAYNEKLQLEERLEELKLQLSLAMDEKQRQQQKVKRHNSSDVSQSGYTSEDVPVPGNAKSIAPNTMAAVAQRANNSSPDLGIESDAGRVSSVELSNAQHALLKTVELKDEQYKENIACNEGKLVTDIKTTTSPIAAAGQATAPHDCAKVDQENAELRRKLIRTKRAFEDTYEKLRLANKAKAQVEKDIKTQILKTHNVLRNVRSNMENDASN